MEKPFQELLPLLFKQELAHRGFKQVDGVLSHGELSVCFGENTVVFSKGKKPLNAVIMMNEGFLCKNSYEGLIQFKGRGTEAEVGNQLANALLGAGLKVSNELFVALVEKFI